MGSSFSRDDVSFATGERYAALVLCLEKTVAKTLHILFYTI
jgi:hypothetical protein